MPFEERTVVDVREEMVLRAIQRRQKLKAIAEEFNVSLPTLRLWRDRYRQFGRNGLADRSHAPHSSPLKTSSGIEALIVADRLRYRFGSKKILQRLEDEYPELVLPARSTIDGILARHGLVEPQKKPRHKGQSPFVRRYEATEPGELMTLDHKGQFRLGNGSYCFPLTICDSFSRYVMACTALTGTDLQQAWPVIQRVMREHGLPRAAQSDNGPPFGASNGKFSTLSVKFMRLGIQPIFSRPGRPGDNGRHERMHRDLKRMATRPPCRTKSEQQVHFDEFRRIYNHERPHEGIAMRRPAKLFTGSNRPYPKRTPKPEYPSHLEPRKVSHVGTIRWRHEAIFVSQAFAGQTVALEPAPDAIVNVFFYGFLIGRIDELTSKFS